MLKKWNNSQTTIRRKKVYISNGKKENEQELQIQKEEKLFKLQRREKYN